MVVCDFFKQASLEVTRGVPQLACMSLELSVFSLVDETWEYYFMLLEHPRQMHNVVKFGSHRVLPETRLETTQEQYYLFGK
eukprot:3243000-Heterocapsa_arctica.AAC.1